jgi:hypothetical protein
MKALAVFGLLCILGVGLVTSEDSNSVYSQIRFEYAYYNIPANFPFVWLNVVRSGNAISEGDVITVDWFTADFSAMDSMDYTRSSGSIQWSSGTPNSQRIFIPLNPNIWPPYGKSFLVGLVDQSGRSILTLPNLATVILTPPVDLSMLGSQPSGTDSPSGINGTPSGTGGSSSGTDGTGGTPSGTPSDPTPPVTSLVSDDMNNSTQTYPATNTTAFAFRDFEYDVYTGQQSVLVVVDRLDIYNLGVSQAASVSYASLNGSAFENIDFIPVSGTLSWSETDFDSRAILLSFPMDVVRTQDTYFGIQLFDPVNAELGNPSIVPIVLFFNQTALGNSSEVTLTHATVPDGTISTPEPNPQQPNPQPTNSPQDSSSTGNSDPVVPTEPNESSTGGSGQTGQNGQKSEASNLKVSLSLVTLMSIVVLFGSL